ncbi:2-dehydropantoate 2-reductase [Aspergillus steynii IBT 23096]|uniref:2-dehydropantoate 2-reductase n=1 Tax=Aspergillus steynii IBT 23096 TaxID=1392250 RepID=A0A2I2GSF2_9EURO|nr:2-dehydropantoate 2-reductase [Aspergillus steynii IBT 23096]PLB55793.1 2-dehydropantoate 2-reductase [Aspergillus steynii IBT 23096]
MSAKFLIFGGGSIGAVVAYLLVQSIPSSDIVVVCRSNYEAVSEHGFTINSTIWGSNLHVQPTVVQSAAEAAQHAPKGFDYACITTKAVGEDDTRQAELLKPVIGAKTTIVLLQNVIGIEAPYRALFSQNAIASAVLYTPCTRTAPGIYSHTLLTQMHHKASTARLVELLNNGGASATHDDDVQIARWKKLLINGSENPICALSRLRDAQFFRTDPGAESFMRDVMMELAQIARKLGYTCIDEGVVDHQLRLLTSRELPGVAPSMMTDALAGQSMEVECIVGNAMRMAHRMNVCVPRMEALYYLTKALNTSFVQNR